MSERLGSQEVDLAPHVFSSLEAERLHKQYSSVPVLIDVSIKFHAGQIHAIVGENGAGKSTLIKILSGAIKPNSGLLKIDGGLVRLANPHDALTTGISVVHQEFNYCRSLSVTENLFLGQRLPRRRSGLLDWAAADARAVEVLEQLSVSIDVRQPVAGLSPATQKLVEIGRALIHRSKVLILDEPTAALPAEESRQLFEVLRRLRDRGVAIVYVSHHLEEVVNLADRISVLRDGHVIATTDVVDAQIDDLVRLMVGRPISTAPSTRTRPGGGEAYLEVLDLSSAGSFAGVSFDVEHGEIVGIAGLEGSGRSEVVKSLAGDLASESGDIHLDDDRVGPGRSIYEMMRAGVAYVPPDRQHEGLHLGMSVSDNVSLPLLRSIGHGPFLARKHEASLATEYVERLDVRSAGIDQECGSLSGGNQQKVLLAKWLATRPRVLLLDEPTRGVDVGAKSEIHALIRSLADGGVAIVVASSDLSELLRITDRIMVMQAGRLAAVVDTAKTSAEEIGLIATAATGMAVAP